MFLVMGYVLFCIFFNYTAKTIQMTVIKTEWSAHIEKL